MKKHFSSFYLCFFLVLSNHLSAQTVDRIGPAGSGLYGKTITILTNGNYVVADPNYDEMGKTDIGAVYLYNGVTHALISTLKGSNSFDYVGNNGVSALTNGNYVVKSPYWNNNRGAATWGNGTTGVNGVLSAANSLVGFAVNDQVGLSVTSLNNGNYVILSPNWDNGAAINAGAVTWANGNMAITGSVNSSNSLVGTAANDQIGASVIALNNGNYVTSSTKWNNSAGAVTWGNGTSGVSGIVSGSNSLVGNAANDQVGITVLPLTNGNYIVASKQWQSGKGAVTWCSGTASMTGFVSSSNSLTGTLSNDQVGALVTALTNGNYVVASSYWNGNRGAVTWGNGASGTIGAVSTTNSLIGGAVNYYVGTAIIPLSNGNYLAVSQFWNGNRGAVTWRNGNMATTGTVSSANSLVGNMANDQVGTTIITLNNGHYVVGSPNWDNGATINVGAATWGSGTVGVSGLISATNSLTGTIANDKVGTVLTALTNGNYVVGSPFWNGVKGAATWANGTMGLVGAVSTSNSLTGSLTSDGVGSVVTALTNGHYVVGSRNWNGNRGAATWCDGTMATSNTVSSGNSLVGMNLNDQVAYFVTALNNGNYLVNSPEWNGSVGAVSWCNGAASTTGTVNVGNSLVGNAINDRLGSSVINSVANGTMALSNGNYVIYSSGWANGASTNAGAVSFGNGETGTYGNLTPCNSVLGGVTNGELNWVFNTDANYLIVGCPKENRIATIGFPNAGASKVGCGTNVITMNPVPASVGIGTWSGGMGNWSGNNYTPSTAEANNGANFVATWTVTNGSCSISHTTTVTVDAIVTANAGANKTTCGTNPITMTPIMPTIGTGAWSGGGGTWAGNVYTPSVSEGSVNGTVTLTWTVVNGTCSATSTANVAISAPPAANAGADKNTCTTTPVTLSPTTPSIGTGAWSGGLGIWNGNDYTPSVSEVGTNISLSWTVSNGVCPSVTDIALVKSIPIVAAPTISSNKTQVCAGSPVTLTATPANTYTASQYLWFKNSSLVATTNTATYTSTTANTAGTEDYSVQVNYTGYNCFAPQSAPITITRNVATATISPSGPISFCVNNPTTLNANAGMNSYVWKKGTTIVQTGGVSHLPITSGSYTVTVTDALGCVATSPITNITINPLPVANAGPDKSVCLGSSIQIGNATNVVNSYAWSPTTNMVGTTLSNPMVSPTVTTTYTLTVTNISTGCSKTDDVVVSPLSLPATPSIAMSASPVCQGTNISIMPTSVGTTNINWYKNGILLYSKPTTFIQNISLPTASPDVYSIKSKDVNGCLSSFSNYQNAWIKEAAIPTLSSTPAIVSGTITVCVPGGTSGMATLTASSATASPAYAWRVGSSFVTGANLSTYSQFVTTTSNNKVVRVQATYPNGCVRTSAPATVSLVTTGCTPKMGSNKDNAGDLLLLQENSMNVYPNPTMDILHINLQNILDDKGKILIYNNLGQVVIVKEITLQNGMADEIVDLYGFSQGIYTLSFQTVSQNLIQKIVKE